MSYRNGTYIAFDGQGTTNPTKSDMKYYGLLRRWNASKNYELKFSDSHKKTNRVLDSSERKTLENRLMERLRNSKNFAFKKYRNYDKNFKTYSFKRLFVKAFYGIDCK